MIPVFVMICHHFIVLTAWFSKFTTQHHPLFALTQGCDQILSLLKPTIINEDCRFVFSRFCISRMHRRVLRHIFTTKLSFKVPAPVTPNKDGREQAVSSFQKSFTLPASLFQCFIVFPYKLDSFSDYLHQKND